jgi:hypothetical protein
MLPVGTTRDGRGSRRALLALALMVWLAAWGARQTRGAPAEAGDAAYLPLISRPAAVATTGSPALGIGFISSAEELADEQQYANALWAGASWNRWPLYWSGVETAEGQFFWERVDTVVRGDIQHGLQSNVILMGTPCFYRVDRCARQPAVPVERPPGS